MLHIAIGNFNESSVWVYGAFAKKELVACILLRIAQGKHVDVI